MSVFKKRIGNSDVLFTRYPTKDANPLVFSGDGNGNELKTKEKAEK